MSEAAPRTPLPRRRRRSASTLGRVLAYSLPYWRTILVVFALMGIYGGAMALRFGMAGLIVDGVLLPADAAGEKGRWVRIFEERVLPYLPGDVSLARAYRASDSTERLEIASGAFDPEKTPEEADSDGLWRYEFTAGVASWRSTAGTTVDRAPFDRLVVSLPAPLPGVAPPLAVEGALISLTRAEGGVGGQGLFRLLALIGGAGVFLSLVIAATNFGREYLALGVQVRTVAAIRADIFRHLSSQGLDFFHGRRSGDIISRVTNDVGTIQQSLRYIFGDLIQHPITILYCLGMAYATSPLLTCIVLPFLPLLVLPILRSGRKVKRHGRGSLERLGEVTESMGQLLSGIRVVKAFGLEQAQRREFDERNAGFVRSSLRMTRAKVTSRSIIEGLYNLMAAVALVAGGWLLARQAIDIKPGDFVVFLASITALYPPLKAITRVYNTVSESAAGAERVLAILDAPPTITDAPEATPFPPFAASIRFEHVWFRYGSEEPWVLRDIDFEARRGETIALVGHSGAGKSTLLDLLPRFHDTVEGRILLDERDLRAGTRASLLAQIAIVGQDPFLFHTTIEENIRGGRPGATAEEVRRAAEAAAIADEIDAMPHGFATVIGERGVKLSGGQRQRITIARAILKNAAILILDEATSALDSESERKVQRALDNLLIGRTTFVIAHRLSTIQHADRILVLDGGRIVESGSHDELAARSGVYARLLRMQEISDEAPARPAPVAERVAGGDERIKRMIDRSDRNRWRERADALIDRFAGLRIGVLGDLIADLYTYGQPVRLSREAPVMIIREEREELIPGGAANTIANLRALGAAVVPVGLVGDDSVGEKLLGQLVAAGVDCRGVRVLESYRTVAKMRLLAGDVHTVKQQVVRIDREPSRPPTDGETAALVETLATLGGGIDAWVVSDYGYAAATPAAVDWVRARTRRGGKGVPTVADSRYRLRDFRGYTVVTPNETELCEAVRLENPGEVELVRAARRLGEELDGEALLVTRGNRGMLLVEKGRDPIEIPIHGTTDIVDVSGAGDTVASVLTLSLAAGADLATGCRLANVASGLKVMKRGAATVSPAELRGALRE